MEKTHKYIHKPITKENETQKNFSNFSLFWFRYVVVHHDFFLSLLFFQQNNVWTVYIFSFIPKQKEDFEIKIFNEFHGKQKRIKMFYYLLPI